MLLQPKCLNERGLIVIHWPAGFAAGKKKHSECTSLKIWCKAFHSHSPPNQYQSQRRIVNSRRVWGQAGGRSGGWDGSRSREKVDNWIVRNIRESEGVIELWRFSVQPEWEMVAFQTDSPLPGNNIIMAGLLTADTAMPLLLRRTWKDGEGGAMNF